MSLSNVMRSCVGKSSLSSVLLSVVRVVSASVDARGTEGWLGSAGGKSNDGRHMVPGVGVLKASCKIRKKE